MKKGFPHNRPARFDRQLKDADHDPYRPKGKLPEPTVCPQCAAVYHDGHWQQMARPANAHEQLCPACHRIKDRFPAGYVTLEGGFLSQHRDDVLELVRSTERMEHGEHVLQRIMDIQDQKNGLEVTTTDVHLARRIGEAIHRAFEGDLDVKYSPDEYVVRVHWKR